MVDRQKVTISIRVDLIRFSRFIHIGQAIVLPLNDPNTDTFVLDLIPRPQFPITMDYKTKTKHYTGLSSDMQTCAV